MDTATLMKVIDMIDKQIKWLDCRIQTLPLRDLQKHLYAELKKNLEVKES